MLLEQLGNIKLQPQAGILADSRESGNLFEFVNFLALSWLGDNPNPQGLAFEVITEAMQN